MLKDITLGQYFPGDSLIHRMDPRSKLIIVVLYIVVLFLAKSFVSYGILVLFLLWCITVSRVGLESGLSRDETSGSYSGGHRCAESILHR